MKPSRLQQVTLALFILIAGVWYWYVRSHKPTVASVNGTYANACCGDLVLQDGVIIVGKAHVPFQLENMKFGLTAYPSMRLEVRRAEVVVLPSNEPSPLAFKNGATGLTVCGDLRCDRVYLFTRR